MARAAAEDKQRSVNSLQHRLADLSREAENPFSRRLLSMEAQARSANKMLSDALRVQLRMRGKIAELDYWKTGFKRVRLYLIKRVLDYLTIETEASMQALGLHNWRVEYATEVETKSGTMRQGVQIIVHSPTSSASWESWSGGEAQRLRLAVSLGLASLIQQMAGVNYKWEVYDEPSTWLSTEGVEDLLECLHARAHALKKSLWLVDHRALNVTSFDEVWAATKKRSGTIIQRLS